MIKRSKLKEVVRWVILFVLGALSYGLVHKEEKLVYKIYRSKTGIGREIIYLQNEKTGEIMPVKDANVIFDEVNKKYDVEVKE